MPCDTRVKPATFYYLLPLISQVLTRFWRSLFQEIQKVTRIVFVPRLNQIKPGVSKLCKVFGCFELKQREVK